MDEIWKQFTEFLKTPAITLDSEVSWGNILALFGFLTVWLFLVGVSRRLLRRLFIRLRMPEHILNRTLAIYFLILLIIGIGIAFQVAKISTGILGNVLHYDLSEIFQPQEKAVETDTEEQETDDVKQVTDDGGEAEKGKFTLANLFYGFAIVFGMFILSKFSQLILQRQVLQAFQIDRHAQFIILRVFHFFLITIGVLISLTTIGISLTSIAIIFGGLSIGIGFGLQNTVANIMSGLILLFERPIKIGDLVEIIDFNLFGRVTSINLRSTVIMSLDEKEIIVPNLQMVSEPVHNLTHYNNRFRVTIRVGVSYGSDVELVKRVLIEVAHAHPEVIKDPPPQMENVTAPFVRFTDFGESSLDFQLYAWIPDSFQRFDVASDLHFMIWHKFKEHGIKIPFPQRDVHFYQEKDD